MVKRLILFVYDVVAVALATVLALFLRDNFETRPDQLEAFLPYLGFSTLFGAAALLGLRLHRTVWRLSALGEYLRLVVACAVAVLAAMAMSFIVNRLGNVARSLPIIQFMLMMGFLIGARLAARLLFSWASRPKLSAAPIPPPGHQVENVLVVGVNKLANLYLRSAEEFGKGAVAIAGILATEKANLGRHVGTHKILGTPASAIDVIKDLGVHGVFVTRIVVMTPAEQLSLEERHHLDLAADKFDIPIEFIGELLGFSHLRASPDAASDGPVFKLAATSKAAIEHGAARPYWRVKSVIERALSALLIVSLSPMFVFVGILVALDVGFPLVFWQQRAGARGVPIRVLKFRTMAGSFDAAGRRLRDDDRVSSIGAFLRHARLDELPQLINVLRGEMSFIGPRPLLPRDQYTGLEARLAVAPGITGWAQVNGGRDVTAAEKAALDVWYVKHASLWIDLKIAVLTLLMIANGERRNEAAIAEAWRELKGEAPHVPDAGNGTFAPAGRAGTTRS